MPAQKFRPPMPESPSRSALPGIGILETMHEEARIALASYGSFSTLAEGSYLMRQGDAENRLHILISGKLEVSARTDKQVVELGMIMPGESAGEMNVIDPKTASADVCAVINCRLWSISKEGFDQYTSKLPAHGVLLLRALSRQFCRRIRSNSERMLRQAELATAIDEWTD